MKVAYAVTKFTTQGSYKLKGIGKIVDGDLVLKDNKTIIEDILPSCKPVLNKPNEFAGLHLEYREIDVPNKYGSYNTIEMPVESRIWYKKLENE